MVLLLPTTTTSDWNKDGRYSRDADGDGGQAEHRVRSSPPETGKQAHTESHERRHTWYVSAHGHARRVRSVSPLRPLDVIPRLSPWRQVSMETMAAMRASRFSKIPRPLIGAAFIYLFSQDPAVSASVSSVRHRFLHQTSRSSDPVLPSLVNPIQYCNTSTKPSIHPQIQIQIRVPYSSHLKALIS